MHTNDTNKFLPAAVIAAGLLIAGAVVWNGIRTPAAAPAGGEPSADAAAIAPAGNPMLGSADAPVTIVEWTDFQCPFCKQFEVTTMPQIVEKYVNAGKVKIVFMDLVFLGNDSVDAALYSRAVWNVYPEKYADWRHAMYEAQDDEGDRGFGDEASIKELTAKISGMDVARVEADVKSNRGTYLQAFEADKAAASELNIRSTPSFVVGTQIMQGALPFANFETVIDAQLK